jgi:hypothetical protein
MAGARHGVSEIAFTPPIFETVKEGKEENWDIAPLILDLSTSRN